MTITVYQKPTCSTCRQVFTTMKDAGARAILARPADRVREIL